MTRGGVTAAHENVSTSLVVATCPYRLDWPRTLASQARNAGSTPARDATVECQVGLHLWLIHVSPNALSIVLAQMAERQTHQAQNLATIKS